MPPKERESGGGLQDKKPDRRVEKVLSWKKKNTVKRLVIEKREKKSKKFFRGPGSGEPTPQRDWGSIGEPNREKVF